MYKNPGIFLLKLSEFFSINLFQFCWNLLATDPWDIKFIEEKTFKLQLTSQTLHIMWKIFCSWLYSKYTYAHTSLEASLRKMKCLKHSPMQVTKTHTKILRWVTTFLNRRFRRLSPCFQFLGPQKHILGVNNHNWYQNGFFEGSSFKVFWIGAIVLKLEFLKKNLIWLDTAAKF